MAQVYGRRISEKTAKPLFNSRAFRLLLCAFIFTIAAVCKNILPVGYREALVVGLDSGLTFHDVLEVFGESASSQEVFSQLWRDGILKVFGFADDEQEVSGDMPDETSAEPQTSADEPSVSTNLDISESVTIPVTMRSEIAIDAGELPAYTTVPESPNIAGGDADSIPQSTPDASDESQTTQNDTGIPLPDVVSTQAVSIPFEYVTPVFGTLTSEFGYREHPIDGEYKFHYGVDIAASTGTDVACFSDGKVIFAGWGEINGNYIKVDHGDGFVTLYAHLHKILIKNGEKVKKGAVIGLVGETGETSGPHLHFQIYYNGKLINPAPFVDFAA